MTNSQMNRNATSTRYSAQASVMRDRVTAANPVMASTVIRQARPMAKAATPVQQARPTAAEIKQAAIEKAMNSAARVDVKKTYKTHKIHFGLKRTLLALACTAIAVVAIVYFVNLNAPNVSLKVAAMQTGIEASYPAYVPRDFSLSDITSESGRLVLNFKNSSTGDAFSITEEKSAWDSNALLNNYVKQEYGEAYTVIKENGLTLFITSNDTTWVNSGIIYTLKVTKGSLTKKQIKSIAVSL